TFVEDSCKSTGAAELFTYGVLSSSGLRGFLVTLFHSLHLILFHPTREVGVDVCRGLASLFRYVFDGESGGQRNRTPGANTTEPRAEEKSAARAKELGFCRLLPCRPPSSSPTRGGVVGVP